MSSSVTYKSQRCNRSCAVQTLYVHHTLQMSSNCTEFLSVPNCITHSEFSFFVWLNVNFALEQNTKAQIRSRVIAVHFL